MWVSLLLPPDPKDIRWFLDAIQLPSISDEQLTILSSPFTHAEASKAVKSLSLHKSHGPDGFTNECYSQFNDRLSPQLTDSLNNIMNHGTYPTELLESIIVTIPKPGKSSDNQANFRPFSLLNLDTKLYAKLLANRIAQLTPSLIHSDQVGFVPGRQTSNGTRHSINLTQWVEHHCIPSLLISLDAEKAFNRIYWTYMTAVLKRFGFTGQILNAITTFYSSPTAKIWT